MGTPPKMKNSFFSRESNPSPSLGKANALSIAPRQQMLHIHFTRALGTRGFFLRATGNFVSEVEVASGGYLSVTQVLGTRL